MSSYPPYPAPVTDPGAAQAARPWDFWTPLVAVLVCAAGYGLFLVVPYYVNDLDRFALQAVANGGHDPRDLWPRTTAIGGLFVIGGGFMVTLGPTITVCTTVWALIWLWQGFRDDFGVVAKLALGSAVLCGVVLSFGIFSPFGRALSSWFLD